MEKHEVFLTPPAACKLVCVVSLTEGRFNGEIAWSKDGSSYKDPISTWTIHPKRPLEVTYPLQVHDPGSYMCHVNDSGQRWNDTVRVVNFEGN